MSTNGHPGGTTPSSAIGWDSKLATVAGKQAPKIEKAFGYRTVGDLLHHYPRRWVDKGSLSDLGAIEPDEHVTVIARVVRASQHPYADRRRGGMAYRLEVVVATEDAQLMLTFFDKKQHLASWRESQLSPGRTGLFSGKVGTFRGKLPADQPADPDVRRGRRPGRAGRRRPLGQDPAAGDDLPGDRGGAELADRRGDRAGPRPGARGARPAARGGPRRARLPPRPAGAPVAAPAGELGAEGGGGEAAALRRGLRHPDRAGPAARGAAGPRRPAPHRPRRRPAGPLRRAAAVRADRGAAGGRHRGARRPRARATRCTGCCRARSAPARRWSRSGRCCAWSTPADRRRCWPRPRCSPSSTTARSPRCSATSPPAACSAGPPTAPRSRCSPARWAPPPAGRRCSTRPRAPPGIVIGTHALLEDKVQFADLGFVVVDEQHRFGVEQRAALTAKSGGSPPHVLVMTATPIPRTVAMTVFGDLETSTLRRAAGRPRADPDQRGAARRPAVLARAGLAADPRGGRQGPPGLRRLPAHRRRRPTTGGPRARATARTRVRWPPSRRWRRLLAAGPAARAARRRCCTAGSPRTRKDAGDARASPPATSTCWSSTTVIEVGVDVANATDDGGPGRRPVRRLPAAPAARPGRPGRPAGAVPAGHRRPPPTARPASGSTRWPRPPTGSSCPGSTSSSAARATCSAPPSPGGARACGCCACWSTRTSSWRPARSPPRSSGRPDARRPPVAGRAGAPPARHRPGRLPGEGMTRIIGGDAGGRRIKAPAGDSTRPTSDRVREALFSAFEAGLGSLSGLRFLDVYAGSGAVGLEARSRGAGVVTLVEHDRRTAALIRENIATLGLTRVDVVVSSAARRGAAPAAGAVRRGLPRPAVRRARPTRWSRCSPACATTAGWRTRRWSWWSAPGAARS